MATSLAQRLVPQSLIPQRRGVLDGEAFETLYRETRDDLYGYLRYLLSDTASAEDATAQAFERAFRKRARFDASRGGARGWLFAIARNAALDELRRRKQTASLAFEPEAADAAGQPHDPIMGAMTRLQVMAALARLQPRERELVALKFFGGLANGEIASVLGISPSNAGTQLHRAIEKLRKEIGDDEAATQ